MRIMRRGKGGRIHQLIGSAEAIGPREAPAWWEWEVKWQGGEKVASGTAQTRRQAARQIEAEMRKALNALKSYYILEDGDQTAGAEYVRVVDVFIPDLPK